MPNLLLLVPVLLCLAACGTTSDGKPRTTVTANTSELTVYCPSDWHDCYQQAREVCGAAGFIESRRPGQSSGIGTAGGRLGGDSSRTEEIYRRAAGQESPSERRLTFQCRH